MSYYPRRNYPWHKHLTSFDREVLDLLEVDYSYGLPKDRNPIAEAFRAPIERMRTENGQLGFEIESKFFLKWLEPMSGFGKESLARLWILCQMAIHDAVGGPEGDGQDKGQRRLWYTTYKNQFAQPASAQWALLGDAKELSGFDGIAWAGRLSLTLGKLVREEGLTFHQMWIKDKSRMIATFYETLIQGLNVVVAVEKDSMLDDFKAICQRLGFKAVVSGKGKQSTGFTEDMLRTVFGWTRDRDPFTAESPLIFVTVTDHDFDGREVIAPTFSEQARIYTPHVTEIRAAVTPDQVRMYIEREETEPFEQCIDRYWFDGKVKNKAYEAWSAEHALFQFECINESCGRYALDNDGEPTDKWEETEWIAVGSTSTCPKCGTKSSLNILLAKSIENQPHTFEVECLPMRSYYRQIAEALLTVVPFKTIVAGLRDLCTASSYQAARTLTDYVCANNSDYSYWKKQLDEIEARCSSFEDSVRQRLENIGADYESLWRDLEDDPEPEDMVQHSLQGWNVWRPFDADLRTKRLTNRLKYAGRHILQDMMAEVIE